MKGRTILTFAALCTVPLSWSSQLYVNPCPAQNAAGHGIYFSSRALITAFSIPAGTIIPLAGFLSDQYGKETDNGALLTHFGLGRVFAGRRFLEKPYIYILLARILQVLGGGTYQLAMA